MSSVENDRVELYVELLKKSLSYELWEEQGVPVERIGYGGPLLRSAVAGVGRVLGLAGLQLVRRPPEDAEARREGKFWPSQAHTMIGRPRLDNLHRAVETALAESIPGDLMETGVWRGGACILMRGILAARGVRDRRVIVADSFAGLPPPDPRYPADAGDDHYKLGLLAVSRADVEAAFRAYGLLDDQVVFLEGFFEDTIPTAPVEQLAVLRLDGDMYQSTIECMTHLYPKLSPGGFCIVDDYGLEGCAKAVDDYRAEHGIETPMERIDWTGVFWRKA